MNVAPTAASAAPTARKHGEGFGAGAKEQMKATYTSESTSMQSWGSSDSGQFGGLGFGAVGRAPQPGTVHYSLLFLCWDYGRPV